MSEPEPPTQERRRASDAAAQVLSGSAPDINAIFQSLVEKFLSLPGRVGTFLAGGLSTIWIFCAFGVTALLASIPFVDKVNEGKAAERDFQLQMFKVQSDVEMKKLDRTLLGEGAMSTLEKISEKLDQQASQTAKLQVDMQQQNAKIEGQIQGMAQDVKALQRAQSSTDRRVGAMQAQIRKIPPPDPPE